MNAFGMHLSFGASKILQKNISLCFPGTFYLRSRNDSGPTELLMPERNRRDASVAVDGKRSS